jgi:carbonic anhydrase
MTIWNIPALEALQRLKEGNSRFVANVRGVDALMSQIRRAELAQAHLPFAIILGCSDSRVPAEIVFDQGLGDLFVIRVAGNIVAPSQIGSIEFAIDRFGTTLVVVLGHTSCGAVDATIDMLLGSAGASPNLMSIVNRIRPAIEPLVDTELGDDREALMHASVVANVHASVRQLRYGSQMIESLIAASKLVVIGAEYDLATGIVKFLD